MNEAAQNPDRKALRTFGLGFATVLAAMFGALVPLIRHGLDELALWPSWPWITGAVIAAWALLHPSSVIWLYRPWMKFATVAQWVNTRIIMLILFYLVIFPIGLLLKLFGKDPMRRKFRKDDVSYRVPSEEREPEHFEKPY